MNEPAASPHPTLSREGEGSAPGGPQTSPLPSRERVRPPGPSPGERAGAAPEQPELPMIPGEVIPLEHDHAERGAADGDAGGRQCGDRPIRWAPLLFFETNPALQFDREKARGYRLDIPAGTASPLRAGAEPGGDAGAVRRPPARVRLQWPDRRPAGAGLRDSAHGLPDRPLRLRADVRPHRRRPVRLADTDLILEVEEDRAIRGEEVKFGGGKVIRDGMGQKPHEPRRGRRRYRHHQRADRRSLGHRQGRRRPEDGRIAAIGEAGNPDVQPGVDIVIGPGTEAIAGGRILTAGGIDAHIHWICPQRVEDALYSGITTMLGGGTARPRAPTPPPAPRSLAPRAHAAGGGRPAAQHRLLRQGQRREADALIEQVVGGACGLKLHEDWAPRPPPSIAASPSPKRPTCRSPSTPIL